MPFCFQVMSPNTATSDRRKDARARRVMRLFGRPDNKAQTKVSQTECPSCCRMNTIREREKKARNRRLLTYESSGMNEADNKGCSKCLSVSRADLNSATTLWKHTKLKILPVWHRPELGYNALKHANAQLEIVPVWHCLELSYDTLNKRTDR